MSSLITLNVNNKMYSPTVEQDWSLAFVLRNELLLFGTKVGCNMGACGACTVILEKTKGGKTTKKAILSCLMLAVNAKTTATQPQTIWTIEGLSNGGYLDPVPEHFLHNDAFQCGFCTPGFIMASKALVEEKSKTGYTGYTGSSKDEVCKALAGHICTCGNLKKVIDTMSGKYYSWAPGLPLSAKVDVPSGLGMWIHHDPCETVRAASIKDLSVIGKPYQGDQQGKLIVTGNLKFGADYHPTGKLYARLLCSTKAKAKISFSDYSNVKTMPGVKEVITFEDCPIWGVSDIGTNKQGKKIGLVSFWGQEIAAVAADDPNNAARAVKELAKKVVYDTTTLTPELNPDTLISKSATPAVPLITITRGEPDTGGAGDQNSDVIKTFSLDWTNYFQHGSLETCSCVVWWKGTVLHIRSSTQSPHKASYWLKNVAFGLFKPPKVPQPTDIDFQTQGTGTAHGDKPISEWCVPAAVLSYKTKKPVELALSRRENFLTRTHQFQAKAEIEIGVKDKGKDKGKIQLLRAKYWGSGGKNPADIFQEGLPIKELPQALQATYKCDHAKFDVFKVFTNKPKCGWWRCVADSPGTFLEDIAMEKMAESLGMAPYEFKFKNLATNLEHQDKIKPLVIYSSNGLKECFEACAEQIGSPKFKKPKGGKAPPVGTGWHDPHTNNIWKDGRRHGVGIAAHIDSHGGLAAQYPDLLTPTLTATVTLTKAGKVELSVGISRASGGTNTAFCHIVAEAIGMDYEDVKTVIWGKTDKTDDGGFQAGSSSTITLGAAYQKAAEAVKDTLVAKVATKWGLKNTDIKIEGSWIIDTTKSKPSITVKDFMKSYGLDITGKGTTWSKKLRESVTSLSGKTYLSSSGQDCEVRGISASAVELLVNETTGEVEILKFANAVDCGRAIFYEGAKKQIEGGIEIQLGQGFFYEQILDKNGATLNPDYNNSKWPTTLDIDPDNHIPIIVESGDACGPYNAKGMGEPCVSNYVCISNAIYNAIGKWIYPPFYPQKVLKQLNP